MIKKFSATHYQLIILLVTAVCLFFIPNFFWGNLYLVGGDDTRLYYIFPKEFLNFAFKMTSDNALGFLDGYYPKSSYASLFFIIYLLKQIPFINVQFFMYGLNLAFGFIFFYAFLGIWVKDKTVKFFFAKVVASLFYIFSTYLINTFYTNQITAMYLVSAMPATLYFFFKSVLDKKVVYAIISVLYISIFSVKLESIPWSFALLICFIPLFLIVFLKNKKRFFYHVLIFVLCFVLLNMYWIAHLFYPVITGSSTSNVKYYSSNNQTTNDVIKISSGIFGEKNSIFNERDTNMVTNFSPKIAFKSVFLLLIIFAGMMLRKAQRKNQKIYLIAMACFLISVFFFQPKFGSKGDEIFIFLNNNLPLFSMFRNMFDKFSFALAFMYAFTFYAGLRIILEKVKNNILLVLLIISPLVIIIINAYSFTVPNYKDTTFSTRISGILNDDFTHLVQFIKNVHSSSRYLWIPITMPAYIYVEDKYNKNHFYYGLSPLTMLADTSDYAGYLSFGSIRNPTLGATILDLIKQKKYDEVGRIFQMINVDYIIDDKQQLPDEAKLFLYSQDMLAIQNYNFKKSLYGPKIKDFNNRYSIYKINPKFDSDKIYLKEGTKIQKVKFTRESDMEYDVWLTHVKTPTTLILQDFFNKNWIVILESQNKSVTYKNISNVSAKEGYANSWSISSEEIKKNFNRNFYRVNNDGSVNIHLKLYFGQLGILTPVNIISLIAYIGTVGLVLAYFIKQKM